MLIESIIINGTILGGLYALLAIGFTLSYGVSRVVNLAHGAFFMIGAFIFSALGPFLLSILSPLGVTSTLIPLLALILATIFVGIAGSIVYRLTIHPILGDEVAVMVVTISVALIIQQLVLIVFGFSAPVTPFVTGSIEIIGVVVTHMKLLALGLSLGLFVGLWAFINYSKIGASMRAVSQDREAAMLMGVNTERLYMLTMGISTVFATLAGVFFTAAIHAGQAHPHIWLEPLWASFAIVVLGGLGSIKGTLIGGFIIAFVEHSVAEIFVSQGGVIVRAIPIATMVLILLVRPKGLFGKRIEME
jgi:branched-chain amino acid transport system permease protein